MNVDWDLPAYPPPVDEQADRPLRVEVLPGELDRDTAPAK